MPDCIVLAELFVRVQKVHNLLLGVVKHADLHWMEEVGLQEVTQDTRNMLKHLDSSANTARRHFGIDCLGVSIAERSIQVVIPPGVLNFRRDIISNFVLWTLAPLTDMPLEMM